MRPSIKKGDLTGLDLQRPRLPQAIDQNRYGPDAQTPAVVRSPGSACSLKGTRLPGSERSSLLFYLGIDRSMGTSALRAATGSPRRLGVIRGTGRRFIPESQGVPPATQQCASWEKYADYRDHSLATVCNRITKPAVGWACRGDDVKSRWREKLPLPDYLTISAGRWLVGRSI